MRRAVNLRVSRPVLTLASPELCDGGMLGGSHGPPQGWRAAKVFAAVSVFIILVLMLSPARRLQLTSYCWAATQLTLARCKSQHRSMGQLLSPHTTQQPTPILMRSR